MDENTAVLLLCNATTATFIAEQHQKDDPENYRGYLDHLLVNELVNDGVAIVIPKEAFFKWVEDNGQFFSKEDLEVKSDSAGDDGEN